LLVYIHITFFITSLSVTYYMKVVFLVDLPELVWCCVPTFQHYSDMDSYSVNFGFDRLVGLKATAAYGSCRMTLWNKYFLAS
jgi:hypothetical protein